jgi:hypothetical protein
LLPFQYLTRRHLPESRSCRCFARVHLRRP